MRRLCRKYAAKFIDIQREEFKRLGVMGEWDNPYLTMNSKFEAVIAREFGRFVLGGSVVKSPKPIYWCCFLPYGPGRSRSGIRPARLAVHLRQVSADRPAGKGPSQPGRRKGFVRHLDHHSLDHPANLGVALNPEFEYVAVKAGGEVFVLAKGLMVDCLYNFGFDQPGDFEV